MSLVSIIIPCYNYGWLLAQTLDSLLAQTYQMWECIIVDDGSTDNTREVSESYQSRDPRFRYIYQSNGGVSRARNNGLKHAFGTYIQFLDGDDLLSAHKLEVHLKYLLDNPAVDLVYGPVQYFDDGNFASLRQSLDMSGMPWMPNVSGQGPDIVFQLVKSNIMVIQSPLIKKAALAKTGFFNESLRYNEDWYLWLKCALVGMNIIYNEAIEGLSYVRVHKASASQERSKMIVGERDMRMLLKDDLVTIPVVEIIRYNDARIIDLNEHLGRMHFVNKRYIKGAKAFMNNAIITGKYLESVRHILYHIKIRLLKSI
jgi:glycosyltransferase involved in cell wall biosynthesis